VGEVNGSMGGSASLGVGGDDGWSNMCWVSFAGAGITLKDKVLDKQVDYNCRKVQEKYLVEVFRSRCISC